MAPPHVGKCARDKQKQNKKRANNAPEGARFSKKGGHKNLGFCRKKKEGSMQRRQLPKEFWKDGTVREANKKPGSEGPGFLLNVE
ncbi:hypothetical protein [Hymenobacter properus]|uniref:Uncharacterized protein n=1 Tax=Hymenobacter properus TaxID=2791026 RepID=A0A931BJV4_9BACT|nr:hypothetical protein [Hymenobacter properus]MBF9143603.1 hypothetical protein [Hymenobacter properus]MBR7722416.1 hypothetical protein [Microvirga sp. SRT04]